MRQKSYRKLYCPVPQEQRPLNEYLNIKNSFFFNWPTLKLHKYIYQLIKFGLIILFFSIFITNFFYYFFEFPNKFVLLNFISIITCEIFLILRIYLGWSYIGQKLNNPIIEYEESSWYDGQIWVKPIKILKQDRLIYYHKVFPVLKRLKKTIVYLLLIYIMIFLFTIVI